jgi:hypothetical protein
LHIFIVSFYLLSFLSLLDLFFSLSPFISIEGGGPSERKGCKAPSREEKTARQTASKGSLTIKFCYHRTVFFSNHPFHMTCSSAAAAAGRSA